MGGGNSDIYSLKYCDLSFSKKIQKNTNKQKYLDSDYGCTHDPSGQKEEHVQALKQQRACHIPGKGLGYKVGGSTKDDLTGTGRRDQGLYRLVRGFCLHPKSKRKPLEV